MTHGKPTTDQEPEGGAGVDRLVVLCGLLLAAAALFVSGHSLGFGLVRFDDDINITFNPHLGPLSAQTLPWILTDADYVRRYIPVGWLTLSALYGACGLSPIGYHAAAILFHVGSSVLVFAVLFLFAREATGRRADRWAVCLAFLGGTLWSLHPFRVETTGWASGLLYSESGFFALLSLALYLGAGSQRRSRLLLGLSAAAYLASLLTYPMSLGWASVFVMVEVWRGGGSLRSLVPSLARVWVMFLPAVLVAVVTVAAGYHARDVWPAPPSLSQFPLSMRVMQAAYVWMYYLWRMLWPVDLTPEPTQLISFDPGSLPFVASAGGLVAITAVLALRSGLRPLLLLWLTYLGVLAPMVGLTVTPHYPNDRYAYLPSVVVTCAALAAALGLKDTGLRRVLAVIAVLTACILASLSIRQAEVWRDTDTVYRVLAERASYLPAKVHVLCRWALRDAMVGRMADADRILSSGERDYPGFGDFQAERRRIADMLAGTRARHPANPTASIESNLHLEFALDANREGRAVEAREHFREALALSADSAEAHFDYAVFEAFQGDPRAALHSFYAIDPSAEPAVARGRLLGLIGDAFSRSSQRELARKAYGQAMELVGLSDPTLRASLESRKSQP